MYLQFASDKFMIFTLHGSVVIWTFVSQAGEIERLNFFF